MIALNSIISDVLPVLICGIVLIMILTGAIVNLYARIKQIKAENASASNLVLALLSEYGDDIKSCIEEVYKDIESLKLDCISDCIIYFKVQLKTKLIEYINTNHPQYSIFVTEDNIDKIIEILLPCLNITDSELEARIDVIINSRKDNENE